MSIANSIVYGPKSTVVSYAKPYPRSQILSWNPVSGLAPHVGDKPTLVRFENKTKRNSFVVYANSVPGIPPPPPSKPMSWILGLVVTFILPFFSNKWGPLWVLKNRIDSAVHTVENIVETVEKVAEEVDRIAEDFADDIPDGKLKDLVRKVEHLAEKTAKTADSLDNVIDQVQQAEEQVEDIVECAVKEIQNSPQKAEDNKQITGSN